MTGPRLRILSFRPTICKSWITPRGIVFSRPRLVSKRVLVPLDRALLDWPAGWPLRSTRSSLLVARPVFSFHRTLRFTAQHEFRLASDVFVRCRRGGDSDFFLCQWFIPFFPIASCVNLNFSPPRYLTAATPLSRTSPPPWRNWVFKLARANLLVLFLLFLRGSTRHLQRSIRVDLWRFWCR